MQRKSDPEKNISPGIMCTVPWRLIRVIPLQDYCLQVEFVDGTCGVVEMKNLIMSKNAGVFANLQNITQFNQVHLVYGAATWPDGIDLAPDAMYSEIKKNGKWVLA